MGNDSLEVRRIYLEHGGNARVTAAALGISRQLVEYHVRRANRLSPLTYAEGAKEDRAAVQAFVRAQLKRAGIHLPNEAASDSIPDPERVPTEETP